ncbi:dTMP kinase [Pullulanibacillus sp. KACC 23026]|uniref:dTMP kinase n=1 Tax=Pullulanibacillus sp. KACC 23026 TaxID=3028315 RepID=UPI0023B00F85|nr:dTMP kinase [Pullulanibacillus sp. KACC 23026]WEG12753.1 dTMP kinase [Pullulanibacillus sp. KACC 23026]
MAGIFITLEGPDGAGKTTQVKKLADWLKELAVPHVVTREPGGTPISDAIRALLLDPNHKEMASPTEILLYAASRAQHVEEKIKPALAKGWVVLCDRFVDASIAYQGYGLEMPVEEIEKINQFATGGLKPTRTYLIDLSPEVGKQRLQARVSPGGAELDRIEQKQISYHERVREGFYRIYKENEERMVLIDGNRQQEELFEVIKEDLEALLRQNQFLK